MPQKLSDDRRTLSELEPVAEELLDRHLRLAKDWYPHEYAPFGEGRDFNEEPWTPDQPRLDIPGQVAFEIGLVTEDNLPSYYRIAYDMFGRKGGAWLTWLNRWAAEEGRHAVVLRDYLVLSRNVDPIGLERSRMRHLQSGYDRDTGALRGLAYVTFQELATRVGHANTGRYSHDPIADRILTRIAADENLHMVFYRDVVTAAFELDPSATTCAVATEVMAFEMPGRNIPGFTRKAAIMADAGIYDLRTHHDQVVWPLLRHWGLFERSGLDAEAERQRTELSAFLEALDTRADRFQSRREERLMRSAPR